MFGFGRKKTNDTPQLASLTAQLDAAKANVILTAMRDEGLHLETVEQAVDYMIVKGALDASEREKFIQMVSQMKG